MAICLTCNTHFHGEEQFCPRDGTPLQAGVVGDRLVGRVLSGRYRLIELLGQGGMGSVYRAHHILMDKPVAVKVLRHQLASDAEAVARFHREARSASRLDHENIIRVTDFGQSDDGLLFLVMELLDGENLADVVNQGPLPWMRAVRITHDAARGLAHAHEQGIIHRDMKPENIILARRPKSNRTTVKVLDFGLAKLMHEAPPDPLDEEGATDPGQKPGQRQAQRSLTRTGVVFGTPEYMSPEQAEGVALDHRTDIYGLGVLCYQMVTGQVPFTGTTFLALITKTVQEPPEPPTQKLPGLVLPAELESLILRCLAKAPADRPQTAEKVAEELMRIAASAAPDPSWPWELEGRPGSRPPSGSPLAYSETTQPGVLADSGPSIRAGLESAADKTPPAGLAIAQSRLSPASREMTLPGDGVDVPSLRPSPSWGRRAILALGLMAIGFLVTAGIRLLPGWLSRGPTAVTPFVAPSVATPVQVAPIQPEPRSPLVAAEDLLVGHRVDEALEMLNTERQRANTPALQRLLSAAHEAKDNRLGALAHMYKAVSLSKGGPEASVSQLALAELLSRTGHAREACSAAGELLASQPDREYGQPAEVLTRTLHCKKP